MGVKSSSTTGKVLKDAVTGKVKRCTCCDGGCCISVSTQVEQCLPDGKACCGETVETAVEFNVALMSGSFGGTPTFRNYWRLTGVLKWQTTAAVNGSGTCVWCLNDPVGGIGDILITECSVSLSSSRGDGGCDGVYMADAVTDEAILTAAIGIANEARHCACAATPRDMYFLAYYLMAALYEATCPGGTFPWTPPDIPAYCTDPVTGVVLSPGGAGASISTCNYDVTCSGVFADEGADAFVSEADERGGALTRYGTLVDEAGGETDYDSEAVQVVWSHRTVDACPGGCELPTAGACCSPVGVCSEEEPEDCAAVEGTFVGGPCTDVTCVELMGACCDDGVCTETTEAGCAGQFQKVGSSCAFVDCGASVEGACCSELGTCEDGVTLAECVGGEWFANLTCEDEPCGFEENHPCCKPDGTCETLSSGECTAAGGTWHPTTPDCGSLDCTWGACCLPAGGCTDTDETDCAALGGSFLEGVACEDTDCQVCCCMFDPKNCGDDYTQTNFVEYGDCIMAGGEPMGGVGQLCPGFCCDPVGGDAGDFL